jgi:hypothetical protein
MKIQIERKVIEWKYRALFGMTKVTWVLAPIELTVKDPKVQRGATRRLVQRQERNNV